MKPITFEEQTVVFAEKQDEYGNLPAFVEKDGMGQVISCWQLTFREKIKLIWTGKLWVSLCMFGKPLTPSYFTVHKKELLTTKETK